MTPGKIFREAVEAEHPLQCVGVINAYAAILAKSTGYRALYLSGGGVAAASCGMPDLGVTTMDDVATDLRRITDACDLPVLVDIDTGWGGPLNIARAVKMMEKSGAAAIHIEDQVDLKRCGHRPDKSIVSQSEMTERVKAAVDARADVDFVIMARTDALAVEGMNSAIDRACEYVQAGADMIFPEAMTDLEQYTTFAREVSVPVLANITEFGSTPLFTVSQLSDAGVSIVLYPLSAFRAASQAMLKTYEAIRNDGTQQGVLDTMQTRDELYQYLDYHKAEETVNRFLENQPNEPD
ncbi:MAG: methylisocitrate lyase [Verrucomicrobiales bacterium]|nr:methylisocitrate lyase [Verrucomicrobiales bacterium]